MKRLFTDSENNTPVARWWARGAGIGLAALFLAAINFGPTSTIATILTGVFVVIVIAFLWKGINGVIFVRWWARTVGVVSAAIIGLILIGGIPQYGPDDIVTIAMWAWGLCLIAWIHGLLGTIAVIPRNPKQ